ncbi:paraquat-inducible protein A [Pelagibius litoralis]|uniref:Paraquat-inducible protein A n=1 Tax=Pelagibius litoralis TaxID=374515 RepID=A0A967EZW9_9PROT|nr:paraquat-inducible protein A [Pelagibius litoralis]NIA70472.1 paraquat-inducible protein A [Pelagibius litoralis]
MAYKAGCKLSGRIDSSDTHGPQMTIAKPLIPRFSKPATLAAGSRGPDRFLGLLILAAAAALLAGWLLPVMTVRTLLVFYDEVSIMTGAFRLLDSGDYVLFLVIVLFTVVLPVGKLLLAYVAWSRLNVEDPRVRRALGWIETLGRWSMLDVFVAALLVVVIKLSLISDVEIHAGLYVFILAVILSMIAVRRIAVLAHRSLHSSEDAVSGQSPL